MKKNVGKMDRIIRVIIGISIIGFGIATQSWWGLIGLGILLPAIMGSDPLYTLVGISTNNK